MKKMILLSLLLFVCIPANADFIGAVIGVGGWQYEPAGSIRSKGGDINLENNLGLEKQTKPTAWISFEHPVPLIPNIEARFTSIGLSGSGSLNTQFGSTVFSGTITDELDLTQIDATVYYEILDNWLNLDIGFALKYLEGEITITSQNQTENKKFTGGLPMVYAKAAFDLPLTGFSVGGKGYLTSIAGNEIVDIELFVSYEMSIGLGVSGGYRSQSFKLDDIKDISSDIELTGAFVNVFFHL